MIRAALAVAVLGLTFHVSPLPAQTGTLSDIEGIGPASAQKLANAGVHTPKELLKVGGHTVPSVSQVEGWIRSAKKLKPAVEY